VREAEFRHPRLTEIYVAECAWAQDDDYFVALVNETPTGRVLDVGCGTGRLALALAAHGHIVTGLDPAGACLARARLKPSADRVIHKRAPGNGGTRRIPDARSIQTSIMPIAFRSASVGGCHASEAISKKGIGTS
jgi:SAM-dependent methyltransferase